MNGNVYPEPAASAGVVPAPSAESGYLRVGRALMAIGTGLRAIVVLVFLVVLVSGSVSGRSGGLELVLQSVVLVLVAGGTVVGYVGWSDVKDGRYQRGGTMGMIAAALPPIDWLYIIGGVLVTRSDEAHGGGTGTGETAASQPA